MTTFIWILAWLPLVLPAMSTLPKPINVNLTSEHFVHVLTWEPGPGTPTAVHYSVAITTKTETSWVPVAGCQHVRHPLNCSLTEAFSDPEEGYFTQVKAVLGEQESQPGFPVPNEAFHPEKDTFLDLPLLTVTSCGQDLCVDLQPPMEHLREHYDSLKYELRIKTNNADRPPFIIDTESLRRVVLDNVASGNEYCVSVCFSDSDVPRKSNYSQPVCALTPGHYTADPWISTVLCLLVMFGVILLALLVSAGFLCLRRRALPSVLTSIHHIEEALLVPSCHGSSSSLLNVKPTAPSSGDKRSSQTSDESDEESVTEITGGSRGGGYEDRGGGSTSSSSSSLSAPSSPGPNFCSNQTPDFLNPETELQILTETHSTDGLKEAPSTHTASHSDGCHADSVGVQDNEDEEEVREGDRQDVDLLTLTFGRYGEEEVEEEEEEKSHSDMTEVYNTSPNLPSETRDTKEVAIETLSSSDDEEGEEEEHCGYMGRS